MAGKYDDGEGGFRGVSNSTRDSNVSRFFNNLGAKVKKIAEKAEEEMSQQMINSLRGRKKSNHGQYPKWTPNPANPKEPKHGSRMSFRGWKRTKTAHGWAIHNDATNPDDGYNYPYNLMTGKGWSRKVRSAVIKGGGSTDRLVLKGGGKIFSKQMPNGIAPWLRDRKREMKKNIQRAIK